MHRKLRNLRDLKLQHGHFSDSGLDMLHGLTALRSLRLRLCNNITVAGIEAVVVSLSQRSLSWVRVSECDGIELLQYC